MKEKPFGPWPSLPSAVLMDRKKANKQGKAVGRFGRTSEPTQKSHSPRTQRWQHFKLQIANRQFDLEHFGEVAPRL
jgi:hypothetical protein